MATLTRDGPSKSIRLVVGAAWATMLSASMLPNALLHELTGGTPIWLSWAKIGLLLALAAVTLLWGALQPLRHVVLILLTIFLAEELVSHLTGSARWQGWFSRPGVRFTRSMMGVQLGRLIVSLMIIVALLVLSYRRIEFFLVPRKLDAPIKPVRWFGFPKPDPWTSFGGQFAIYIGLGLLVFLIVGGRPSWSSFVHAVPMLPAVLLLAAMNAFNEEMTYRASLLTGLEGVLGSQPAVWNTAVFFGLGHYFGVPYSVVGVFMSMFLGWILGKAMLETRGFFWAWFIHLIQDVLIFSFMAAGSITPAG